MNEQVVTDGENFPVEPLSLSEMEHLSAGDECVALIQSRHHIARGNLFIEPTTRQKERRWDFDHLAKLALCMLEAVPIAETTAYFSREFELMFRGQERKTDLSTKAIHRIAYAYFSPALLRRIKACRDRKGWRIANVNPENKTLIASICRKTGLDTQALFSNVQLSRSPALEKIPRSFVLRAYLMRLESMQYSKILSVLGVEDVENNRTLMSTSIRRMFSAEALNRLPKGAGDVK